MPDRLLDTELKPVSLPDALRDKRPPETETVADDVSVGETSWLGELDSEAETDADSEEVAVIESVAEYAADGDEVAWCVNDVVVEAVAGGVSVAVMEAVASSDGEGVGGGVTVSEVEANCVPLVDGVGGGVTVEDGDWDDVGEGGHDSVSFSLLLCETVTESVPDEELERECGNELLLDRVARSEALRLRIADPD